MPPMLRGLNDVGDVDRKICGLKQRKVVASKIIIVDLLLYAL